MPLGVAGVVFIYFWRQSVAPRLTPDEWAAMQTLVPSPGAALVVVLREQGDDGARVVVTVDEVCAAVMQPGEFTIVELRPGAHQLVTGTVEPREADPPLRFDAAVGDVFVFRMTSHAGRPRFETIGNLAQTRELIARLEGVEPSY